MTNAEKQEYFDPYDELRNIQEKIYDERISNIISVVIVTIFIINLYSGLESVFEIPHSYISLIGKIVVATFLFANIMVLINRINQKIVLLFFFTAFVAGSNFLFFPDNQIAFTNIFITFLTICLPMMICIYAIKDMGVLYRKLKRTSYIIGAIVLLSLIGFNLLGFTFNNNEYSVGFGASIMLPACFLIEDALNKKPFALILALAIILAIVLYGSRGPLLSIGLWLLLYLYQSVSSKNVNKKINKKFGVVFLIGIFTFIFLYFDGFNSIYQYFEAKGVYSRSLYLFANDFGHLSNRDILYNYFWDAIKDSPFEVRGIGADRVVRGAYPHNIVIELLYQLGILIAVPLLVSFFIMGLKSIFNKRNTSYNLLITIFFCAGLVLRIISGSLWEIGRAHD